MQIVADVGGTPGKDCNGFCKYCYFRKVKEIKTLLGLDEIKGRHWVIMPCCGLTGEGLKEGLDWLVSDINARIFMLE